MPGFDGTGPLGLGPRTGRGLGYCPPYPAYGPAWYYRPGAVPRGIWTRPWPRRGRFRYW
ncbi:MAG: DUF5320 domain-containing protein [Methanoculleaceae archaeon]